MVWSHRLHGEGHPVCHPHLTALLQQRGGDRRSGRTPARDRGAMIKARYVAALLTFPLVAGRAQDSTGFSHADSLRGSNGPGRAWWDVSFYDLHVRVEPADSSIRGYNTI